MGATTLGTAVISPLITMASLVPKTAVADSSLAALGALDVNIDAKRDMIVLVNSDGCVSNIGRCNHWRCHQIPYAHRSRISQRFCIGT